MLTRPIKAYKIKEKQELYCQCRIAKGDIYQIAYIPKKLAVLNEVLKIKENGKWDNGWVVQEVWHEVDESFIDGMRNALIHHAEVSDI
jgi:hypothetical protein